MIVSCDKKDNLKNLKQLVREVRRINSGKDQYIEAAIQVIYSMSENAAVSYIRYEERTVPTAYSLKRTFNMQPLSSRIILKFGVKEGGIGTIEADKNWSKFLLRFLERGFPMQKLQKLIFMIREYVNFFPLDIKGSSIQYLTLLRKILIIETLSEYIDKTNQIFKNASLGLEDEKRKSSCSSELKKVEGKEEKYRSMKILYLKQYRDCFDIGCLQEQRQEDQMMEEQYKRCRRYRAKRYK
jgi:hypothetical protein